MKTSTFLAAAYAVTAAALVARQRGFGADISNDGRTFTPGGGSGMVNDGRTFSPGGGSGIINDGRTVRFTDGESPVQSSQRGSNADFIGIGKSVKGWGVRRDVNKQRHGFGGHGFGGGRGRGRGKDCGKPTGDTGMGSWDDDGTGTWEPPTAEPDTTGGGLLPDEDGSTTDDGSTGGDVTTPDGITLPDDGSVVPGDGDSPDITSPDDSSSPEDESPAAGATSVAAPVPVPTTPGQDDDGDLAPAVEPIGGGSVVSPSPAADGEDVAPEAVVVAELDGKTLTGSVVGGKTTIPVTTGGVTLLAEVVDPTALAKTPLGAIAFTPTIVSGPEPTTVVVLVGGGSATVGSMSVMTPAPSLPTLAVEPAPTMK